MIVFKHCTFITYLFRNDNGKKLQVIIFKTLESANTKHMCSQKLILIQLNNYSLQLSLPVVQCSPSPPLGPFRHFLQGFPKGLHVQISLAVPLHPTNNNRDLIKKHPSQSQSNTFIRSYCRTCPFKH